MRLRYLRHSDQDNQSLFRTQDRAPRGSEADDLDNADLIGKAPGNCLIGRYADRALDVSYSWRNY
jgi:hypothetical protein